ncbi:hypothetical protein [Clostridium estertheticum]|uniref:hypothetical protein n=1 Tax=Clostridium estertheticum TaxID=238834 RepID=UPI00124ED147|nr:hypothetical protein [Clostridium estertheticum]MBZ9615331.1 hypothetical protein [Clostridium estertheticum subsp. laramiense]WAG75220.1 hypothetical protein LL032_07145 [Clostridium estertheticum]
MWIRSQNKFHLINTNDISVINNTIYSENVLLGEYKTNGIAIEVVDKIQKCLLDYDYYKATGQETFQSLVYQMPSGNLKKEAV